MRKQFLYFCFISVTLILGLSLMSKYFLWAFIVVGPLVVLGLIDFFQKKSTIRRNYPLLGKGRYIMEDWRPKIYQYFIESDTDGTPISRIFRSIVYQRSKNVLDTVPFGTQIDVNATGYEWIGHSMYPLHKEEVNHDDLYIKVGGKNCKKPYDLSLFNISAMSYGSLSDVAVEALNWGAKVGAFAHNTGEGGISPYHLKHGGDLIWQIGTGYFGCRTSDGGFDAAEFADKSTNESVKMIEVKLSQGAKPGHGGILPAAKVSPEIAEIRGVPLGRDVISPPNHAAFSSPKGLLDFVVRLRDLSGGKPVGFKLCVGRPSEFLSICRAMVETEIVPDFITVDGAEGGTGAAPMEFSNSVGMPLTDGLLFVHNALLGCGLRDQIRVICSAKIVTGFNMIQRMAIGADLCNSARAMMFALGCIQALKCNTNHCPVGVTTQEPDLVRGLDVNDKKYRVHNYHLNTISSFLEILAAAGLSHPSELQPHHIQRRISPTQVQDYGQIYQYLEPGELLSSKPPSALSEAWDSSSSERF